MSEPSTSETDKPTRAQLEVLRTLARLGGEARRPDIRSGAGRQVASHLGDLHDSPYLDHRPDPMNPRGYIWHLTDEAVAALRDEAEAYLLAMNAIGAGVSPPDSKADALDGEELVAR